jgi:hypothetical protein
MTSTKKETYHPAGCALLLVSYLQAYTLDAAQALEDPERAGEDEQIALARIRNGSVSRCKDTLVEVAAAVTGRQPAAIFQQLLAQAGTRANKSKVVGSRRGRNMAWSFKTPDRAREIKIAS